LDTLARI